MTLQFKEVKIKTKELVGFTCDKCKKEFSIKDDLLETQEFMHWSNSCGYGSIFGDSNEIEIALCQHCTKELLGKYINITEREF